jgi:hypothetical protein
MKKNLFNQETERYNEHGVELAEEIQAALDPIFDKYAQQGFSIRETELVAHNTVNEISLSRILWGQHNQDKG